MKKRIVFAVINDLSYDRRMHRICTSLQHAGYEVELVGRVLQTSVPLEEQPFAQYRLQCWFTRGAAFYAEYNLRLFMYLLRSTADIFAAVDLDTSLAFSLAARLRKRRAVFDAHEHFTEVPEVERRKFVRSIWQAIGKWSIPQFHACYTVSDTLAAALQKEYMTAFTVIRNVPVLSDIPIIPPEEREKLIVYQGALNEGRGLEAAIMAMHHLPDFHLNLIGEGDLSSELKALAVAEGLQDRVEFIGYVLPQDLHWHTALAMFGLNLLESKSRSYYFSLANKFFDYMHAGVPSINMRFPEYEKIIAEYPVGVCIDNLDPWALAQCIRLHTGDARNMQDLIAHCAQAREIFCWQREEQLLCDIYRSIT